MSSNRLISAESLGYDHNQGPLIGNIPEEPSPGLFGISYWVWGIIVVVVIFLIIMMILWFKGYFGSTSTNNSSINSSTNNSTGNSVSTSTIRPNNTVNNPVVPTQKRRYSVCTTSIANQKWYFSVDVDGKLTLKSTPQIHEVTINSDRSITFDIAGRNYILVSDIDGYNLRIIPLNEENKNTTKRVLAWHLQSNQPGLYNLYNPNGDILYSKYDQNIKGYQVAFTGNDKGRSEGWSLSEYGLETIEG